MCIRDRLLRALDELADEAPFPLSIIANIGVALVGMALSAPLAAVAQTSTPTRSQQLLDQLENGDPLQQEQAAEELAAIASPTFVSDLTRIFRASDNPRPAATVLGAIGTPAALAVLVTGLSDEALFSKPIKFPEEDQDLTVWQVLIHVANHGTDHRAQILRALHDLGIPTFDQDLILYLWKI